MHFATAKDGMKLAYRLYDFTDPWENAPHILLMAGLARHSGFWYQWIPYLSRFYKIIAPDLRGFGQSREGFSTERNFNLDTFTQDIATVLDHAGIEHLHYCGEAFGGVLGMQVAATFPERIRTLSLVGAPIKLGENVRKAFAQGGGSWGDTARKIGVRAWIESTNKIDRFPAWMPDGFIQWYTDEISKGDQDTVVAFSKISESFNQLEFLERIKCPVLGIYPNHRWEHAETLKQHVKDLTIQNIPVKYSLFKFVHPRETAEAVLSFVAQKDGRLLRD